MKKYLLAALCLAFTVRAAEVVTWTASPTPGVTGHKVYGSLDQYAALPWPVLGRVSGLAFTNFATGRFAYYVVATNACCESVPSDVAMRQGKYRAVPKVRRKTQ